MRTMTWKDAVEFIGILAIVAGLYFVYEELKQYIVSVVDEALQNQDLVEYFATFDQQVVDALAEH